MYNLATDSASSTMKAEWSGKLMAILEKTDDPRLTDASDKPPYVSDTTTPAPKKRKGAGARGAEGIGNLHPHP